METDSLEDDDMRKSFAARLGGAGPNGTVPFFPIRFDVAKTFATTTARVRVKGTLNGFKFRHSIIRGGWSPVGPDTHVMFLTKVLCAGAKCRVGDTVRVVMEPDVAPRVRLPAPLKQALARDAPARAGWEGAAYTLRKELARYVEGAKKEETRARRIEKALAILRAR